MLRTRWLSLTATALVLVQVSCHGFFTDPILTSISVTPSNPNVAVGSTQQFTAVGVNDDGSTTNVSSVTWSASPDSVATIDANGLATAVAAGAAVITAQSDTLTGQTTMNVTTSPLTSITISSPNSVQTVAAGSTLQLTATATFADNTSKDVTSQVTWQSSNTAVATISATGLVTGVAASATPVTITATSGNIVGQFQLTVV
ncbi:MAG: Ig domain-containing protein [Terriglobales bacterium]